MNKNEMLDILSKRTQMSRLNIEKVLSETRSLLLEVLNKGGDVSFYGFGRFGTKERKERLCRNPLTKRLFYSSRKKYVTLKLFRKFKYSLQ